MIGLMLLTLAVTTASGILMSTTALWGNSWIELVHGTAAYAMLFLIGGHLLGVFAAAVQHRENLVLSMITGKKWVPANTAPYLGNVKLGDKTVLLSLALVAFAAATWQGSTLLLNGSIWRMHKTVAAELAKLECADAKVQMPRFEIYPAFLVNYIVSSPDSSETEIITLTLQQALERRPDVDFSGVKKWCEGQQAKLSPEPAKSAEFPVAESTASLPEAVGTKMAEPVAEPIVVGLPAAMPPLHAFPARALSAPELTQVLRLSSATEILARLDIDLKLLQASFAQIVLLPADVQSKATVKIPAKKALKTQQVRPKVKPAPKRKSIVAKKRSRQSNNWYTENQSRESSSSTGTGRTGRGDRSGGSSGSVNGSGGGSGNGSSSGAGGDTSGRDNNGSGNSGSSGNNGSGNDNSGSGKSGRGDGKSGSGNGNSGRSGGDKDDGDED